MSSIVIKSLGGIFMLGLIAGAPSCADNDSSIFIRQVQFQAATDDCIVSPDTDSTFLSRGVIDTSLTSSYSAWLLVGNQLSPRGNSQTLRPETSRVHLYEAEVTLFSFDSTELAAYSQPITGFADPTTSSEPGYGLANVQLVDPSAIPNLPDNQTIVARVKVFGRTLGGIEVETGYWDFPIEVCSGCLATNRCQLPKDCDAECIFVCNPGQDVGLDCRTTGALSCPGVDCTQPSG